MGKLNEYKRYSAHVTRSPRWKALRLVALDQDGWQCVHCGSRHRLEVDHILPVRDRPDLSFVLSNLQTLCGSCHAKKTRTEAGLPQLPPERQEWRKLLRDMQRNPLEQKGNTHA